MAGTPVNLLSNYELLDHLVVHENDDSAIKELTRRLTARTTTGRAAKLIAKLTNAIRNLCRYDTDNIRENRNCQKFGRLYWEVRQEILNALSKERQIRLFTG